MGPEMERHRVGCEWTSRRAAIHWALLCVLPMAGCHPPESGAAIVFTDVTLRANLPKTALPCIAMRDFDGDGKADILMAPSEDTGHYGGVITIHENLGLNQFRAHSITVPLSGIGSCAVGDVDNDGLADVVFGTSTPPSVVLLHGSGPDKFSFDPPQVLITFQNEALFTALALADIDNDGRLDIVAGTYSSSTAARPIDRCDHDAHGAVQCYFRDAPGLTSSFVLHNDGGAFSRSPAPLPSGLVNSISVIDWDRDGWVDLFMSNDFGPNLLLHNDHGTGFTDILPAARGAAYNHGMGAAIADLDGDGFLDLYNAEIGADQVLMGKANGGMEDGSDALGIWPRTRSHIGWSPVAADLDNDGVVDLFVANNLDSASADDLTTALQTSEKRRGHSTDYVFRGKGGRTPFGFEQTSPHPSAAFDPIATASGDIDGDGYLDILEAGALTPTLLLRNDSSSDAGHWLCVHLTGTTSNRDGVGAIVEVLDGAGGLGPRFVGAGGLGASPLVVHFGLGARSRVDGLVIHWPGGKMQRVDGPLEVDRVVNVTEQP